MLPSVVTLSLPYRLTARLCLALVLLTGLTPAQGVVVCIEEDGCVSIEVKPADANCSGCEGHEESDTPVQAAATSSEDAPCRCIDLVVPAGAVYGFLERKHNELTRGADLQPSN